MKRLFFLPMMLLAFALNAQTYNYAQKWKEIETLSGKGEVKSLLPKVNDIYAQAKKDGKGDEAVKSLLCRASIISQTKEDAEGDVYKTAILDFEKEIAAPLNPPSGGTAPSLEGRAGEGLVTRAILQSLLANLYEQYAQNTRWKRRNITELETPPADIAEWTTKQLQKKALELYFNSIINIDEEDKGAELLLQEKTENWKKILANNEDIDLYPNLKDISM